ncbi:MAG: OadG family protein [Treponema sp.]|jgi:oxaloacetate decarboxylase gamma subunit|nr:OadG family protein [Treponema sp.]
MTIMDMLGQSGVLTVFGMSVVFSFLIILILAISLVGKIIIALKLNKELVTQALAAAPSASVSGNAVSITAAISAAVKEYRKSNK